MFAKVANNWRKDWYQEFMGRSFKMEHTTGKWEISWPGENVIGIFTKEYGNILMLTAQSKSDETIMKANANRICQCVNGWDELQKQQDALLEACKEIVLHWYGLDNDDEKAGKSHCMRYCQNLIEQAIILCEKP